MKKLISLFLAAAVIITAAPAAMAEEYSVYDKYSDSSRSIEVNAEKDGLYGSGNRMAIVKDGEISPYTGFAKTKKGTYCYKDGVKWTGWFKKGSKWYYFDPRNDGLKALKTAKTPLGTYYLDENGAWNGKASKSAKAPADFGFAYRFGGGESSEYYFSTKDGILVRNIYLDGVETEKNIKISSQDMQIIYDVFKSSGAESFDSAAVIEAAGIESEPAEDMPRYSVEWYSGDEYKGGVYGDTVIMSYAYYSRSEEIRSLAGLLRFSDMYIESRPEYKEIVAEENAFLEAHKYDEAPFEELDEVKTISADIYKFRGFSSPGGGRAMLITSKSEMNELISMLKKEGVSEKSKLIGTLSAYPEKYFEKNAVVFGDCNAVSGSVKPDDPKVYTGYSNIYIEMILRYPECYTDDECYIAAVAEASKKQLGCENEKPAVIWRRTRINYEGNVF
ncbi:MAG: hypothetical protein MSJ26_03570 [Oscillospiraceae bacterium]|nr:hypothetical protein [Oscillospiraceae bacterium]